MAFARGSAIASGMICDTCGRDHDATTDDLRLGPDGASISGPNCHCIKVDGQYVARGICCGRMLGEEMMADEEAADARRAARVAA